MINWPNRILSPFGIFFCWVGVLIVEGVYYSDITVSRL